MRRLKGSQAKLLVFSFAVILACFIFPDLIYAEPTTACPDTTYFEPAPGFRVSADGDTFYLQPEGDVKINFNLKNQNSINAYVAALIDRCYDGDIFLDPQKNNGSPLPQCFVGSRTVLAGWEAHILNLSLYPPQFLLTALLLFAPSLPPGDGPLATLTFTATDTGCICLDTLFFPTGDVIWLVDTNSVSYTPEFISKTFYVRNCPYLPGDLNWDEEANVLDVQVLIHYLFRNGEKPCPLKSADVNCDQKVSISDAVYLINYLFRNGTPPQECEY
jgi:hypothetical protein